MHNYDVIIIGAGSIGIPTAMALAKKNIKTLVIDAKPSPGQGDNKKAIGGIRATHSNPAKIKIAMRSLEIFSTWEKTYGNKIDWVEGGYLFPVYRNHEKKELIKLLYKQQEMGLNIKFISSEEIIKIVPKINKTNLLGGVFSPNDGSASPLLSINAFYQQAIKKGAKFKFKETVKKIIICKNKIEGVITNKKQYKSPIIVDAAGSHSANLCKSIGVDINVYPDLHEAAITEPIEQLFKCMIVDLRPDIGSKNFYLYQNPHGQVIFCMTPSPPIIGTGIYETSSFLPKASRRIINLLPMLYNIRVRRSWRGCYPMTLDGFPIIGWNNKIKGLFHSTGMCGQGFMLGPGIGELTTRILNNIPNKDDIEIQKQFSPIRQFSKNKEKLE